jgi:hypothetical protein
MRGAGPVLIPALAESAPIEILRGASGVQRPPQFMEPLILGAFAPIATQRLQPGSAAVAFDAVSK